MAGVSLYWMEQTAKGPIYACDDIRDALIPKNLDAKFIKRGKWVTDEEFREVQAKAFNADPVGAE
jgi:hypothetical protein